MLLASVTCLDNGNKNVSVKEKYLENVCEFRDYGMYTLVVNR
jgi:hypothetical protein